jgi:hypothetical protein
VRSASNASAAPASTNVDNHRSTCTRADWRGEQRGSKLGARMQLNEVRRQHDSQETALHKRMNRRWNRQFVETHRFACVQHAAHDHDHRNDNEARLEPALR